MIHFNTGFLYNYPIYLLFTVVFITRKNQSSPITLVSEIGGNLFLSKTPSEDSGGSPVPPLTPNTHESNAQVTPG